MKRISTDKISLASGVALFLTLNIQAQTDSSLRNHPWNFHYQSTVISQQHPAFPSKYSGANSLDPTSEFHTSISSTLYFGWRLWKGAEAYFNPELSGGEGFSRTTGVAGFPNGEVYRVSDPRPHVYFARLYFTQVIPISHVYQPVSDDLNQLPGRLSERYISFTAGRFSVMDFFDDNTFSHDPRTQFFNWALMGNGAWDYAANTRGYTYGMVLQYVEPQWALRSAFVLMPTHANGSVMDFNLARSGSQFIEYDRNYSLSGNAGTVRLIAYLNRATHMGSYAKAIEWGVIHASPPSIDSVAGTGRSKFGFGINVEQKLGNNTGLFFRAGWNDGRNETWAFTEIDRTATLGIVLNGLLWRRKDDRMGLAQIINGISTPHRNYLEAGGYGFIIGDGALNYKPEMITELYYSFVISGSNMSLSPDYQLILNPAYNRDRGPVQSFGMRMHIEY